MSSDSICFELWLAISGMGGVLCHCWCCLPWCQCGSYCHFDHQVCCQGSSPTSYTWGQGWVQRTVAQLECQLLGCPMQRELEEECWLYMLGWCGYQSSGALKFWSGDRSECFTPWACGTSTRLGSSREKPWEKPHWIGLTHLRKDLPKGCVHLLSYPGPLVLMFLNHPELLVLTILGQPF